MALIALILAILASALSLACAVLVTLVLVGSRDDDSGYGDGGGFGGPGDGWDNGDDDDGWAVDEDWDDEGTEDFGDGGRHPLLDVHPGPPVNLGRATQRTLDLARAGAARMAAGSAR